MAVRCRTAHDPCCCICTIQELNCHFKMLRGHSLPLDGSIAARMHPKRPVTSPSRTIVRRESSPASARAVPDGQRSRCARIFKSGWASLFLLACVGLIRVFPAIPKRDLAGWIRRAPPCPSAHMIRRTRANPRTWVPERMRTAKKREKTADSTVFCLNSAIGHV